MYHSKYSQVTFIGDNKMLPKNILNELHTQKESRFDKTEKSASHQPWWSRPHRPCLRANCTRCRPLVAPSQQEERPTMPAVELFSAARWGAAGSFAQARNETVRLA